VFKFESKNNWLPLVNVFRNRELDFSEVGVEVDNFVKG
jgi:hypothetical protein